MKAPHSNARPGKRPPEQHPDPDSEGSRLHIACLRREKSAWVRVAQRRGGLAKWVRAQLNDAASKKQGHGS